MIKKIYDHIHIKISAKHMLWMHEFAWYQITLSNLTHMMIMADPVAIDVETPDNSKI